MVLLSPKLFNHFQGYCGAVPVNYTFQDRDRYPVPVGMAGARPPPYPAARALVYIDQSHEVGGR